jgi:hypothetical protein
MCLVFGVIVSASACDRFCPKTVTTQPGEPQVREEQPDFEAREGKWALGVKVSNRRPIPSFPVDLHMIVTSEEARQIERLSGQADIVIKSCPPGDSPRKYSYPLVLEKSPRGGQRFVGTLVDILKSDVRFPGAKVLVTGEYRLDLEVLLENGVHLTIQDIGLWPTNPNEGR